DTHLRYTTDVNGPALRHEVNELIPQAIESTDMAALRPIRLEAIPDDFMLFKFLVEAEEIIHLAFGVKLSIPVRTKPSGSIFRPGNEQVIAEREM
ncbi:MAG TPA: hypothetical protein VK629_12470, partial [Steroidobacteraceae bacterium]|nr:hypothetical protein [Steroidobacteraceae bacterium]